MMSSWTSISPPHALWILLALGILLTLILCFFFFNALHEGLKALGRILRDTCLFFGWAGLGLSAAAVLGFLAFSYLYRGPLFMTSRSPKKQKASALLRPSSSSHPPQSIPDALAGFRPPLCHEVLGQDGRVFDYYCPHGTIRVWTPLKRIDKQLAAYVVMLEDGKFYEHGGLDTDEILNALQKDIKAGKFVRGGSTITQQLAKNLFLSKEKSILRKLEEVPLALRLEKELSKSQILELYFNTIEWGPGVHGIEAASRLYFDHDASQLTEPERWMMALMIPNPKELNLWVQPRGRKSLLKRARQFSIRLKLEKHISEQEREGQFQEFLSFLGQWAQKKPASTWDADRRFPAAWAPAARLVSIPAVWRKLAGSRKKETATLNLEWNLQGRLSKLTRGAFSPGAPHAGAIVLRQPAANGTASVRAIGPWAMQNAPTPEILDLATQAGAEIQILPLQALTPEELFVPHD